MLLLTLFALVQLICKPHQKERNRSIQDVDVLFKDCPFHVRWNVIAHSLHSFVLGPCAEELKDCPGTPCYMKTLEAIDIKCTCLPKNSMTEDHQCYQPYTRGPCQ